MPVLLMIAMTLVSAALLGGCGESPSGPVPRPLRETPVEESSGDDAAYRVIEVDNGGSISGSVRWSGDTPEVTRLPVRVQSERCGRDQPSLALRVTSGGGVMDALVSLLNVEEGVALPEPEPQVIEAIGCRFVPHVSAVTTGATLLFRNTEPALHNVHGTMDGRTLLDLGLPEQGAEAHYQAASPGLLSLRCDAGHPWMAAVVGVFPHPYFSLTDAQGNFRIQQIPPGRYMVQVWHEGWRVTGTQAGRPTFSNPVVLHRQVSVSARQETSLDFSLEEASAEAAGSGTH